jgi:hypothetical protein
MLHEGVDALQRFGGAEADQRAPTRGMRAMPRRASLPASRRQGARRYRAWRQLPTLIAPPSEWLPDIVFRCFEREVHVSNALPVDVPVADEVMRHQ